MSSEFKIKVLNLDGHMDSSGEVIDPAGVTLKEGYVPVTFHFSDEFRNFMGHANLERVGDEVFATIKLFPDWEKDRGSVGLLTPAVGGSTTGREGNVLKAVHINRIGLSMEANQDKRIESIDKQLATKPE